MKLQTLLNGYATVAQDLPITGLALDSRLVTSGNVFIALAGSKQHGLVHGKQAAEQGAAAIVYDPSGLENVKALAGQINGIPVIAMENLALKLGEIAARFYGHPSRFMEVIGITGTNGKTSCSQFLGQLLDRCGIIGTLGWGEWGKLDQTLNTTPDALSIQRILAEFLTNNKQSVAMEVSSHGLEQGRVNGVNFTGAVFTNISRDHLDYHGSMEAYFQAKLELLNKPGLLFAVVNLDDSYSGRILAAMPEAVAVWGITMKGNKLSSGEIVIAEKLGYNRDGIEFDLHWQSLVERVQVPLFGNFNGENILTVAAVMLAMGMSLTDVVARLKTVKPVVGRMERFGKASEPVVFVDYAHTPDALEKVLVSLRKHCQQALWVVFGCGGNRDRGKRPQMGACAVQWADQVIITDDNPRYEDSLDIVKDILIGCGSNKVKVIQNREKAIKTAITQAAANDCIVIAGKGHEDYQEINGMRHPFSDGQVVIEALKMRAGNQ